MKKPCKLYVCIIAVIMIVTVFLIATRFSNVSDENKSSDVHFCLSDSDCIPLPSECHPQSCINKLFENNYQKPEMCTTLYSCSAAYRPEDCACINNRCINENLGGTCE